MRGAWAPLTRERRSSAASDARGKAHAPGKAHTPAPQIVSQLPQASDLAPSSSAAAPCRYDSEKRWMTLGATAPEDGFYGGGGPGGGEGGFVDGGVDGGGDGDEDPCNSEDDDQHHSQFFSKRGWAHSSLRRSRKSAPSALEMPSLLRRGARAKLGRGMLQGGPRLQTILSTRWARTLSGENRTSTESSYWQERGVDELDDQAHDSHASGVGQDSPHALSEITEAAAPADVLSYPWLDEAHLNHFPKDNSRGQEASTSEQAGRRRTMSHSLADSQSPTGSFQEQDAMPKAGKPVHDWTTEECAVWVQQQLASQVIADCGDVPMTLIRVRKIDGAALIWFSPPTWEGLGVSCAVTCAQLMGELKRAIALGERTVVTERRLSTHPRESVPAYFVANNPNAPSPPRQVQLKRSKSMLQKFVPRGGIIKTLYTTLRTRSIEFPPIDHDIQWTIGVMNCGRPPEQIRAVCEQQLDSYMLIYLLVFSTLVPSVLTVLFSDNHQVRNVSWNGNLPDMSTLFDFIYLLLFAVLSLVFIATVTHVHYTATLMGAVSDANLLTFLRGPGCKLMGEVQGAFIIIYSGTVLLLSMTFAKAAGVESPWWMYLILCLNGLHIVIAWVFPVLMFHASPYARMVLHSGLMDQHPLPIADGVLDMTSKQVNEILAGYTLENMDANKGDANPPLEVTQLEEDNSPTHADQRAPFSHSASDVSMTSHRDFFSQIDSLSSGRRSLDTGYVRHESTAGGTNRRTLGRQFKNRRTNTIETNNRLARAPKRDGHSSMNEGVYRRIDHHRAFRWGTTTWDGAELGASSSTLRSMPSSGRSVATDVSFSRPFPTPFHATPSFVKKQPRQLESFGSLILRNEGIDTGDPHDPMVDDSAEPAA